MLGWDFRFTFMYFVLSSLTCRTILSVSIIRVSARFSYSLQFKSYIQYHNSRFHPSSSSPRSKYYTCAFDKSFMTELLSSGTPSILLCHTPSVHSNPFFLITFSSPSHNDALWYFVCS